MTYEEYIASEAWRRLRDGALERDGHRCRTCNATEGLEAHHRAYSENWEDDTVDDLTTLCSRCHKVITSELRGRRYAKRNHTAEDTERTTPCKMEVEYDVRDPELSDQRRSTPAYVQRATGGSAERVVPKDKRDIREALKD